MLCVCRLGLFDLFKMGELFRQTQSKKRMRLRSLILLDEILQNQLS